ncbi:alpha/beta fold hydrolase [Myxococcus sp. MxC21-1]|uniref:alpha/beta fold hydrolase n=1 Tax=Myxococcus sp. MxC21-1 TaxID=3041439 RepID=UPI003977B236
MCLSSVRWEPAHPSVRGVVVVIHGLRDYSDRYGRLAETLQPQGFAVVAQDHRGHGHSGGDRQRMESLQQLVDDVDGVVQDARVRHPDAPVVVFGHRMGGLIATHDALQHTPDVSGLSLSGAAIALPPGCPASTRDSSPTRSCPRAPPRRSSPPSKRSRGGSRT